MRGWWKCPSGQACDPRWASLTLAERGLLASLLDAADGTGEVPVGALGAHQTAEALSGREDTTVVADALAELLRVGIVHENDDALVIDLQWPEDSAPTARQAQQDATRAPSTPRGPVDVKALKKLLSRPWSEKKATSTEARLAWVESAAGQEWCRSRDVDPGIALAIARGETPSTAASTAASTVLHGSSTAGSTDLHGGLHGSSTAGFPPVPPSGERDRERKSGGAEKGAREPGPAAAPRASTVASTVASTAASTVASTERGSRATTTPMDSSLGGESRADVLLRVEKGSAGGFSMGGPADDQDAVASALMDSGLSLDEITAALRKPWEIWPRWERVVSQRRISVAMLARGGSHPGEAIEQLVAFVRAQGAAPVDNGGTVIPTLEETEARVARERADRARILAGPPRVMPQWRRSAPTTVTDTKEVAGG